MRRMLNCIGVAIVFRGLSKVGFGLGLGGEAVGSFSLDSLGLAMGDVSAGCDRLLGWGWGIFGVGGF